MPKSITLIGLGNILLRDEGFGVHFIRYLENHFFFPKNVSLIDGGCAGLGLLNLMRGKDVVYLFDIYRSDEPPGTLRSFDWETIEALEDRQFATVHQLGVKDALQIARFNGVVPEYFKAFAIVPQRLEPGIGLSEILQQSMEPLRHLLFQELARWEVHPKPKAPK